MRFLTEFTNTVRYEISYWIYKHCSKWDFLLNLQTLLEMRSSMHNSQRCDTVLYTVSQVSPWTFLLTRERERESFRLTDLWATENLLRVRFITVVSQFQLRIATNFRAWTYCMNISYAVDHERTNERTNEQSFVSVSCCLFSMAVF
jgi:hypothetical protein